MKGGIHRNRRQYRLIHEFYFGKVDPKEYAIHHCDFNSKNDRIENLKSILHEDHRKIHSEKMIGQNNPYHRMSEEWKQKFSYHPGDKNGRYSGHSNEDILEEARSLYREIGKFTHVEWVKRAKEKGMPQYLNNDFRFGSWNNFKSQVINNHKVKSVEFYGYEDVYNITVEDNHNYFIVTSSEDDDFVKSSGVCVKNCGEIVLSPYDSCRLLLINFYSFVKDPFTDKAEFDFDKLNIVSQKAQRLSDDLVDLEIEQIEKIIKKIENDPEPDAVKFPELSMWTKINEMAKTGRRTGLGVTGIGDTLAALGITYGSDESIEMVEKLYKTMTVAAYRSSCILAKERGAFPIHDHAKEKDHPFLKRIWDEDREIYDISRTTGRRNIALTTTAPAGTVSILSQTTAGIEPAFLLRYTRRRKITDFEENVTIDHIDDSGDKWTEYEVVHHGFKKWMEISGEEDIEKSPYYGSTSDSIDWIQKIKLQAAAQKWICHSLSNTCNVPADTTVEDVKRIYEAGWKLGCKGVTVYRAGSRDGVLIGEDDGSAVVFKENIAPERPKDLHCHIHQATIKGEDWTILVGLLNDRPYEIMGGLSQYVEIPKKCKEGILVKRPRKTMASIYDLEYGTNGDITKLKDVVAIFDNPDYSAFTRTISLALRHGAPIQFVVEQLQKDKDADLFSFSKVISRVLKNYIVDGTESGTQVCPNCESEGSLRYLEGCVQCASCGWSRCS